MRRQDINFLKRFVVLVLGLIVMGVGIACFLKAQLGANPLTTLTQGLSKTFGTTIGQASQWLMGITTVIVFFIDRSRLGVGTLINVFLTGIVIDKAMGQIPTPTTALGQWVCLGIGIVVFAIGLGSYVSAQLGEGAIDSFTMIIKNRSRLNLNQSRMLLDVILLILGAVLGGSIGVGTVLGALVTGPIMKKTMAITRVIIGG